AALEQSGGWLGSRQQSTPPCDGPDLVMVYASHCPLSSAPVGRLHHHGESESAAQRLLENRSRGPQSRMGEVAPKLPHPKTSLEVAAVWAQPGAQEAESQPGSVLVPVAHWPQPVLLWRLAKNSGGSSAWVAPVQPVGEEAATSSAPEHTCHP